MNIIVLIISLFAGQFSYAAIFAIQKVKPINLHRDCYKFRETEPKYELSFQPADAPEESAMHEVRLTYSDICESKTAQRIVRIYYNLEDSNGPVVGIVGNNEDNDSLSFVTFSKFILKR